MHSVIRFAALAALGLTSSIAFADDEENHTMAAGIGGEATLDSSSTAGTSKGVAAILTAAILHDQHQYSNYYGPATAPLYALMGTLHYNVAGLNHSNQFTTGFKLDGQVFVGGTLLKNGDYGCHVYAGVGAGGSTQIATLRPGDSGIIASIGPETGLLCRTQGGLLFMVSPYVGAGYAGSFNLDNSAKVESGRNYHTIAIGGRVRASLADLAILSADAFTTPDLLGQANAEESRAQVGRLNLYVKTSKDSDLSLVGHVEGVHIRGDGESGTYSGASAGVGVIGNF
jgi:hypothetical protein